MMVCTSLPYTSFSNGWILTSSNTYHGNVSSASTGRLAALRLPFFESPPKLMELSTAGASTSISSSMSDMVKARLYCSSGAFGSILRPIGGDESRDSGMRRLLLVKWR